MKSFSSTRAVEVGDVKSALTTNSIFLCRYKKTRTAELGGKSEATLEIHNPLITNVLRADFFGGSDPTSIPPRQFDKNILERGDMAEQ